MTTKTALTSPFTTLADLLLPLRCAGCETRGSALCPYCRHSIDPGDCPPTPIHRPEVPAPVHALTAYEGRARAVLLAFKERDRRDLAKPLGHILASSLMRISDLAPARDGTWWLVPTPSRASAARRRGGSHLLRLARATAAALAQRGEPACVAPALRFAAGVRDSVGLDRAARTANLAGRIRFRAGAAPPPGTPVILLDDIVTTGATAAACAHELNGAAREVSAIVALAAV
ncbi:MAG TPA: ComF family protein [Pseudonocardiaceae bacterium]|nr:ComF family protein [Pseudonocardiaceae bacterium]